MPPPDSGHALTPRQIALLTQWIAEGAKWDLHWAYVAPTRPELPAVRQQQWVRNPIDRFVLARLEQEGLQPSPEADKATLLRRLTYDLTGLPPTPAEIDAFLADRSPDAYETRVDRPAGIAALRRAHGRALARHRALRRHARLSHRQPARDVALSRLGDRRVQPESAVRSSSPSSRSRATCCRTPPTSRRSPPGSTGITWSTSRAARLRRSTRSNTSIDRVETTSNTFMGLTMGCARCHYAQVRSDHAEGVLPVLRVLQQRARGGPRRSAWQRRARSCSCRATSSGRSWTR